MRYIYFGTIFATTIIFLLLSILLFIRRKEGERSRSILSAIMFISFLNYLYGLLNFNSPGLFDVMPVDILMLKVFLITTFIMYPIEVISPKWLTIKRIPLLYIPVLIISLAYKTCLCAGLGFNSYTSSNDLFASDASFDIICRLGLIVLILIPIVLLFFLLYTSKYSNTNTKW